MKRLLLLFVLCWSYSALLWAQPYGNEWINYSKTYYKFKVAQDGIIRIPYSTLSGAGLTGLSGSGFKVFFKGQELPVYVTTNGTLGTTDYIEFYGTKNDGQLDSRLFQEPEWQLHDYRSLFTDTISYFLVWDNATPANHYQQTPNNLSGAPAAEPYFMHTARQLHWNQFYAGKPFRLGGANNNYPDYEDCEGFVSSQISAGGSLSFNIPTPAKYTGPGAPTAELNSKLVGRSNDFPYLPDHHTSITVNGTEYANLTFEGYNCVPVNRVVFLSSLTSPTTSVVYNSLGDISDIDNIALAYTEITYPRQFDFGNETKFRFTLSDNALTYLEIGNFNGGSAPVLYDITNRKRITPIFEGGVYKILLQPGSNTAIPRELYLTSVDNVCVLNNCTSPCIPGNCNVWTVSQMTTTNFTNFSNTFVQGDFVIITHPSLRTGTTDWVSSYAAHRESLIGGNHNATIINVEELYDQFAWGISKHPLSIRNFINYAIDTWSVEPQYLFLVGKSVSYESVTNNPLAYPACLVPTWGHHPSDNMLTVRDFSSYIPQIPVGRLSAKNPAEVQAYYEKMLSYDQDRNCTENDRSWTKKVIHVANGHNITEMNQYLGYVNSYKDIVEAPYYAGTVVGTFTQSSYTPPPQPAFHAAMNAGASLVTLMGHSVSADEWNFDIKEPEEYTNNFKNPLMFAGSCFVGDIHSYGASNVSMAEKYVLIPEKGAIGFLATVSFGFPEFLQEFGDSLYREFSYLSYNQPIGHCVNNAMNHLYIADPANPSYEGTKITLQEYTLEGDPAFVLVGSYNDPEYVIATIGSAPNIKLYDATSGTQLTGSPVSVVNPGVNVEVTVNNIGQALTGNITITVQQQLPGGALVPVGQSVVPAPIVSSTYTINGTLTMTAGIGNIIVTINSTGSVPEDCSNNNTGTVAIQVQSSECAGLPQPVITGLSSNYCASDAAVTLAATPAGGTFTVNGSPATTFNPATPGAGTYTVAYSYIDVPTGCLLTTSQSVQVTAAPNPAFTVSASNICLTNGQVTISLDNVAAGANYVWNFSGGNVTSLGNQTYQVSWATAGNKLISLSASNNGCSAPQQTFTVTVESPLATPVVNCGTATTSSVTFNWVGVAGATGYQVVVNGVPVTTLSQFVTSYTQSGLSQGEAVAIQLTALGTGICGNSTPSAIQTCVAQNCAPVDVVVANVLSGYCTSDNAVNFVGSPGGGSFLLNGQASSGTFDPGTATPGTYTLQYEYSQGSCEYSSQLYEFVVTENPTPAITGDSFICPGTSSTLTATNGFNSYVWNNGSTEQSITVSPSEETNYTVSVTNTAGCIGTAAFTVSPAPQQTLSITTGNGNTFICEGDLLNLTASDGFASYQWGTISLEQSINISQGGSYTVLATDDFGCTYTASIEITESAITPPDILANGGSQTDFCSGETVALSAGAGYSSYTWSTGATTTGIDVTAGGNYSVTVTNANGCEAFSNINLNITTVTAPQIEASAQDICVGQNVTLDAGSGYTTYAWSNGSFGSNISISDAGTYSVTVTLNGCEATASITIPYSEGAIPEAAFEAQGSPNACAGEGIRLDNLSVNASAYLWTFTNTQTGEETTSAEFEPAVNLQPGSYTVSLVATALCGSATDEAAVESYLTVNNTPSVEVLTLPTTICPGDEVQLEGQTTAETYQWFAGEIPISSNLTVNVKPNEETIYTLLATNAAGCSAADSVLVSINEVCELPNAITPNADGFNDTWLIPQAQSNPNVSVIIFNRWGQEVYSTKAYNNGNGWDGTNNDGKELAKGTYYYLIDLNDGSDPLAGPITILR
ncbi:hypothetical protein C7N43_11345 [Sphingobacteriales bacterium UPWRP_1]|nr:hypothetical protein B6N25_13365 [Sphingobacteriales bacterium TSM_CSS]PSJ76940.1 hypothetical protein C7N43_11345 [Sphingobacteriales bacterium UPWRP_1]